MLCTSIFSLIYFFSFFFSGNFKNDSKPEYHSIKDIGEKDCRQMGSVKNANDITWNVYEIRIIDARVFLQLRFTVVPLKDVLYIFAK